jgi:hypothetical protein
LAGTDWRIEEHDNGRVLARLDQFPEAIRARVRDAITKLTNDLLRQVEAAEPNLLRPHTHAYVDTGVSKTGHWIRGRVRVLRDEASGVNYGKIAGALEYGGPGKKRAGKKVKVHAYRRQAKQIRAYERRQPKIQARRFLRGPALAMRPRVVAALRAAIGDAWKGDKPTT